MQDFQKAGGGAALAVAAISILTTAWLNLWPSGAVVSDPLQVIALIPTQMPTLMLLEGLKVLAAIGWLVMALGVFQHVRSREAQMTLHAAVAAALAVMSLLVAGLLGGYGLIRASQHLSGGAPGGLSVFVALSTAVGRLGPAAVLFSGLWIFITSWGSFSAKALPVWLCILGLPLGVMQVGAFFSPALTLPVQLVEPIWLVGVGITLLRGTS